MSEAPTTADLVAALKTLADAAAEVHRLSERACVEWFFLADALEKSRAMIARAGVSLEPIDTKTALDNGDSR